MTVTHDQTPGAPVPSVDGTGPAPHQAAISAGHPSPASGYPQEGLTPAQAQEAEALGDYVTVPVADTGVAVRILPQGQWRMSHMRLLNTGDLEGWAECVIHEADIDAFLDLDLTIDEFQDFSLAAAKASGDDLGKSRGRSRSSRNMRRR
jgi:hypothetical protein